MSNAESVKLAFDLQSAWCAQAGSPFMAALMQKCGEDVAAGGPTARLVGDWSGNPLQDALPMRLAGALQAATLSARAPALAAQYPAARADWSMDAVWPLARDLFERDHDWVARFIQGPPQTNETRRAIGLLPGFLELARFGPLHTLELGASAGLNLNWDRFRYETAGWSWGEPGGPRIDTDWRGPPPTHLDARVVVASRAACDRNPLDVNDQEQMLRLRSYIWADQADRFTRLDAAIALARTARVKVERADAGEWLGARLAAPLPEGVTVIYHSVFWQYPPQATRDAITTAIAEADARATPERRVAWLRYEPNPLLGLEGPIDDMAVELQIWPEASKRIVAKVHGHGRWVEPLGSA